MFGMIDKLESVEVKFGSDNELSVNKVGDLFEVMAFGDLKDGAQGFGINCKPEELNKSIELALSKFN